MIVTVTNFKGGVGKTMTAIHIAAFLQQDKPTLLVDGDLNRSVIAWDKRGGLPYKVVDERQAAKYARSYEHIVFDTAARPTKEDLQALADGCDLIVVPTTPDAVALDALMLIIRELQAMKANYKILITMTPPKPNRDGEEARTLLRESGYPLFDTTIRRLMAYQKAALGGITVGDTKDPKAIEAWGDYVALGKEILG